MFNLNRNYLISSVSAILLHVIIMILMLANIHHLLVKNYGKKTNIANIPVYFYHENHKKNQTEKMQLTLKNTGQKVLIKINNENSSQKNISHAGTASVTNITGNNDAKLLEILHDKIRENQQYPTNALLLKQQGLVQIAFRLFPDGHLENLHIVHSSGIADLDQSGLAAVTAITPVEIAGQYLAVAKDFYINVVYQ